MRIYFALLITCLVLISACATMTGAHRGVGCKKCHDSRPSAERPSLKSPENPSVTCRECHDYLLPQDHHPLTIDSGPLEDTAKVEPPFRLVDGKMECLTCHRMHHGGEYLKGERGLLVGGPYKNRWSVCFSCHEREIYKVMSPHQEMLVEGEVEELDYSTCLICHAEPPDPVVDRAANVRFQASVPFLCWRCHEAMDSEFFETHFMKEKKTDLMEFTAQRSQVNQWNAFDDMLKTEAHEKVIFPLDSRGRVVCSTCHNPHQPGVIFDEKAATGANSDRRLRFREKCLQCHMGQ